MNFNLGKKGGYNMNALMTSSIALSFSSIALLVLLYKTKEDSDYYNVVFYGNFVFGLGLAWVYWLSLPINSSLQGIVACCYAVVSIIAVVLRASNKFTPKVPKIILSVSILASIVSIVI